MPDGAPAPAPSFLPERGCILGFDFGLARIGVAAGELETGLANPLTTVAARANDLRFAAIARLIAEWHPVALVVGLPRPLNGESAHALEPDCRRFAHRLHGRFGLPVIFADERLTSLEAERSLRAAGMHRWQARKNILDAVAAQSILQHFLDSIRHATTSRC